MAAQRLLGNFNYVQAVLTLSNSPPTVSLTAPQDQATYSVGREYSGKRQRLHSCRRLDSKSGFLRERHIDRHCVECALFAHLEQCTTTITRHGAAATDTSAAQRLRQPGQSGFIGGEASFTVFPKWCRDIQAENFDGGGEGVAYHDSDVANNGGQYRNTAVDVETTSDTGGDTMSAGPPEANG